MTKLNNANTKIAKNTILLYFRMILIILVSLYTSRVLLNVLGVEDFGIYNVVGGVVTMFVFLNGAMTTATQRFLAYDIGRNDKEQLKKTFNATLVIHVAIALILFILIEIIGFWVLNNYLNLPRDRMDEAQWVFHFSAISFMLTIIQVPYNACVIAHERMNIYAYISVFEVLMKLLIVFLLTYLSFDKLKLYGMLLSIINAIIVAIYITYARFNFEETKFELVKDKTLYKTLISYSGWNLFGNFALVAKGQGISIILNVFFGPVVNVAQAIASQVNAAVQSFFSNFQMAVNPQIIKSYAVNDKDFMISLMFKSARYSFYLLLLLSLPIIIEVDTILKLWLKIVPDHTSSFTILILIIVLLDCISGPLISGVQATGNIKISQIIVGSLQILILPISYLLFKYGYNPESTYFVSIVISVVALFSRLIILKSLITEFSVNTFIKEVLLKNLLIAFLSLVVPFVLKHFLATTIYNAVIIMSISFLSSFVFIYFVGINKEERIMFKAQVHKVKDKVFKSSDNT